MKAIKIKHKLIKGTLGYITILVLLISIIGGFIFWSTSQKFVLQSNERLLSLLYEQTMHFLYHPESKFAMISQVLKDETREENYQGDIELIIDQFGYLSRVEVVDDKGHVQKTYPHITDRINYDYSGNPYYHMAKSEKMQFGVENSLVYGNTFIDVYTKKPTLMMIQALDQSSYLIGYMDLTKLREAYENLEYEDGFYAMIDERGTYILHPDENFVMQRTVNSHAEGIRSNDYTNGQIIAFDGDYYYLQYKPIENTQWTLLYYHSVRSVITPIINANLLIFMSTLIIFTIVALSITKLVNSLNTALSEFVKRSQKVAGGDYAIEEIHYPFVELEDLATSFSHMASEVESREEEITHYLDDLRESKEELLAINEELEDQKNRLDEQLAMEQFIVEISSKFVSYDLAEMSENLTNSLSVIGKHFGLEAALLYFLPYSDKDEDYASQVKYTWVSSSERGHISQVEELISLMETFSDDANADNYAAFGLSQGLAYVYPLNSSDSVIGFLALVTNETKEVWSFNEVGFIRIVSNIFIEARKKYLYENALVESREAAQAANIAKSQFLANMSHEIRTPMNGIFGYIELLQSEVSQDEGRRYLEGVHKVSTGLMRLIDDVLDLSKIESGSLNLMEEPFNIVKALNEAVEIQEFNARKKGVEILRAVDPLLPRMVFGDEGRFKQVVYNLLNNAIKFTSKGKIVVSLGLNVSTTVKPIAQLRVKDEGIGIDEEFLEHIFTPFSQEDTSSKRSYAGAGLGMSITKQIVFALNGTIAIESKKGQGTTVTVDLPIKVVFQQDEQLDQNPLDKSSVKSSTLVVETLKSTDKSVLVVEDNAINQLVVTRVLEQRGISCDIANNGLEAYEMVKSKLYDIVFMDCQMPLMDGYECTRLIRQLPGGDRVFIVAMTANAMLGDREKCIAAGMDDYLSKPIDYQKMINFISL